MGKNKATKAVIIRKEKGRPDSVLVVNGTGAAGAQKEAERQAIEHRKVQRAAFRIQPKPPRISPRVSRLM